MEEKINYKICKRCVMDTSDPDITFDEQGYCKHCTAYLAKKDNYIVTEEKRLELKKIVETIKKVGKNSQYDCLIGVSGGVDSTYVAYLVKEFGLRPLAVHLDNGWDSELAVNNVEKSIDSLDIDLYTHVIDWIEFKDLQKSFLKASIPGMEIPSDHAIMSILMKIAAKYKIKYIINGSNFSSEFIMSRKWSEAEGQRDWLLIKNVHKQFGTEKIKTFPRTRLVDQIYYKLFRRVTTINLLDYVEFSKPKAMELISAKLGWVYYGGKHYESIYTRFTQGYIQPRKFKFDKRRAHLSNLICAGEMTREEVILELQKDPYPNEKMREMDREYFIKKLDFTEEDFTAMMNDKTYRYTDYIGYFNHPVYKPLKELAFKFHVWLKKVNFYGKAVEQ